MVHLRAVEHFDLRRQVIKTALDMNLRGLVLHTSGNVRYRALGCTTRDLTATVLCSIRVPGTNCMLVTPTGMPYQELQVEDIVYMPFDGTGFPAADQRLPTRCVLRS